MITLLFALEMVIKLLALSLAGYWADSFNRFDGFIVLASSLEIVVEELDLPVNTQVWTRVAYVTRVNAWCTICLRRGACATCVTHRCCARSASCGSSSCCARGSRYRSFSRR